MPVLYFLIGAVAFIAIVFLISDLVAALPKDNCFRAWWERNVTAYCDLDDDV